MRTKKTRILRSAFLYLSLTNLILYAFAHLAYMFMDETAGAVFEYITLYTGKVADVLIPLTVTAVMLIMLTEFGIKKAVLCGLLLSVSRVFFTIPYYYLIYVINYAYSSVEAISLSALSSIAVVLFILATSLLSIAIWLAAEKCRSKGKGLASIISDCRTSLNENSYSDFLGGANFAFFIFASLRFIFALVLEITDTVSFFVDYGMSVQVNEIITIMINYLLIFALLFAGYLFSVWLKNIIIKNIIQGEICHEN